MWTGRVGFAAIGLAVVVPLTGCGGGSSSSSGSGGKTPATTYVHTLCSAISGFEQIEQNGESTLSKLSSAKNPNLPELKAQVTHFFSQEAKASMAAQAQIERAGVPDVSQGETVRTGLIDAFQKFSVALNSAVKQSKTIGTGSEKEFAAAVQKLESQLQTGASGVTSSISGLPASLKAAGSEDSACASIS
jgi:hypothetical protein